MDRTLAFGVAIGLGLLVAGVAVGAAVGVGPLPSAIDGVTGPEKQPPGLLGFESAGAQCTDDFMANSSSSVAVDPANTGITYARNVSLPDPSHAIGQPTFDRLNESAYALRIPVEATEKPPRDCPGVARYEATMRVPAGEDPWTLLIYHDGERVTVLSGDADSSGLSGAVEVSGRESA